MPTVISNLPAYARDTMPLYYPYSQSFLLTHERNPFPLLEEAGESGISARELATKLGVARRTAYRDLKKTISSGRVKIERRKAVDYFILNKDFKDVD